MNILVTGGLGFIGSHIVNRLIMEGHKVRILDNFDLRIDQKDFSHLPYLNFKLNEIEIMLGDIRDYKICQRACVNIDIIFHNAAISSINKSFKNPKETNEININGLRNLLKAAVAYNVKRFVFSSSGKVYGDTKKLPSKEVYIVSPNSPYALSKYNGEILCNQFSKQYDLDLIVLRYFSVYGPGQKLSVGFIGEALTNILKCDNLDLHANQKMSRDFTFIDDVVQANFLCLNYKHSGYDIFNIGSGNEHSLGELLQIVEKVLARKIEPIYKHILEGTVLHTQADISKAMKILKYEPKTSLENGIKMTLFWMESIKSLSEVEN